MEKNKRGSNQPHQNCKLFRLYFLSMRNKDQIQANQIRKTN